MVDLCQRWLLFFQILQEFLDGLFLTFQQDFYSSIGSVLNITREPISHRCSIDKRAKTHSLNYAGDLDFQTQMGHLSTFSDGPTLHIHFDRDGVEELHMKL